MTNWSGCDLVITEKDVAEAIAECQGQRNPNANTCIKLAAFLTIQREMFGQDAQSPVLPSYSFAPGETIDYDSGSEFSDVIRGKDYTEVIAVTDELMDALRVLNPRLYESVLRKLQ